jgi:hypothetical protein
MSGLVLDRDMLVAKLPPHGDDFGELFSGDTLNNACRHGLPRRNLFNGVIAIAIWTGFHVCLPVEAQAGRPHAAFGGGGTR